MPKNKQFNQKVGKRPQQTFLQRRQTDGQQHTKRCSTSFIIRKMKIKTTMRYYLTLVRMAVIKKSRNNKYGKRCGEKGTLLHCWWECKLIQPLWKTVGRYLKNQEQIHHMSQQSLSQAYVMRKPKLMYPIVYCSAICNSQNMEATQISINR